MLLDISKRVQDKVLRTIEEHNLTAQNQHIVIGLSGGPDSVCLFDVLMKIKDKMNLTIHPVHVNHKFRPGAAERDQQFVENFCMQRGLECASFEIDCNALAQELGMTSEEAGRKARYDAFYKVAKSIDAPSENIKIAVAQNANDQAETVLFRLMRGTGIDGLAGIAYEREERGFKVIRPLLDVYRAEIEEYCEENELNPVTDHTNEQSIYARNKIRLELIPYIESGYNENISESLVRLAKIAAADKDYMWKQTEEGYAQVLESESDDEVILNREKLAKIHVAVRHRIMFKAFGKIGLDKDMSEERIKAADSIIERKQAPKTVQFPRGYAVTVAKGFVKFHNVNKK